MSIIPTQMFRFSLLFLILVSIHFQAASRSSALAYLRKNFPKNLSQQLEESSYDLSRSAIAADQKQDYYAGFYYHFYLGEITLHHKENKKAENHYLKSLNCATRLNDSLKIAWSAFQLGNCFLARGNFNSAYHHYVLAQLAFEHTDSYMYAHTFCQLGELYFNFDAYRNALGYFRQALHLKQQNPAWKASLPYAYWSIAETHYALKDQDSALYYYKLSSAVADTTRNIPYYGNEGIAQILINRKQFDEALKYLKPVQKWYFEAKVPKWIADMGLLYMQIYLNKKDKSGFLKWSSITNRNAYAELLPEQQRRYHETMSAYYQQSNNLKEALKHLKLANKVREDNLHRISESNMDALVQAFQTQRQQNQLLLMKEKLQSNELIRQQKELENARLSQKNLLFSTLTSGSVLVILLLSMVALYVTRQKRRVTTQNQQLEEANKKISETVQQLRNKEERIQEAQMKSSSVFAVLNRDMNVLINNLSYTRWMYYIAPEYAPDTAMLEQLLDPQKRKELAYMLHTLQPFESASFQWEWESDNLMVYEFALINLTEDITVNGFVLQGKDITEKVLRQRKQMNSLETKIRERDQLISEVSQEAALSNLQLNLKQQRMSDLWVNLDKSNKDNLTEIDELKGILLQDIHSDKHWQNFRKHFDVAHTHFFSRLKNHHPKLTINEEKHCVFLKMKLSNKEVAQLTGVAPETVKKARQRLKKKLNLSGEQSLTGYLDQLETKR